MKSTGSSEVVITLDRETYAPGDTIKYTFENTTGAAVFLDPCPGARVQYLGDFDWSEIWHSGRECEVSYISPKELVPGETTALAAGPALIDPGVYRIAIDIWSGSLAGEVRRVYSEPFFVE
jgi:hypothetical protein